MCQGGTKSWLVRGTSWRLSTGVCLRQMAVSDLALGNCARHAWRDLAAWSLGWPEWLDLCCLTGLQRLCVALWVFLKILGTEGHSGPPRDHSPGTNLPRLSDLTSPCSPFIPVACVAVLWTVTAPGPFCLPGSLPNVTHSLAVLASDSCHFLSESFLAHPV